MKGYITQSHLAKLISESIKKFLLAEYHMSDLEELMEYMWLKPNETGLNVDIFVDDGGAYKRHRHRLLLWARNGYSKMIDDFIPFSIDRHPRILNNDLEYNISYDDIFKIQNFIIRNLKGLIDLADRRIGQIAFANKIQKIEGHLNESSHMISEMATLRKEDSGLPMDIWIDEGQTYIRHAPRIKFRASSEQHLTREYSSMLLTNPPTIENMPQKSPLKRRDIEILEQFVIDNLEGLKAVADGTWDFRSQFIPNMVKPGQKDIK